jgi:hypothetical protein
MQRSEEKVATRVKGEGVGLRSSPLILFPLPLLAGVCTAGSVMLRADTAAIDGDVSVLARRCAFCLSPPGSYAKLQSLSCCRSRARCVRCHYSRWCVLVAYGVIINVAAIAMLVAVKN